MTSLPSLEPVRAQVDSLAGGRRRIRFVTVGATVLLFALCAVAVAAWFVEPAELGLWALAAAVVAVASGVAAAMLVPVDRVAVAKRYDDAAGTKDLLSSALGLEPTPSGEPGFLQAVREDAAAATGRVARDALYPLAVPRAARWLWVPLVAALVAVAVQLWTQDPPPPARNPAFVTAMLESGRILRQKLEDFDAITATDLDKKQLEDLAKNLAAALEKGELTKPEALAALARLASQLDKARLDQERRQLEAEKNAARLAKGEDMKDVRRDMEAGRYREAAQKVKKKIADLQKKLQEAIEKKAGKLEIDKLRERIKKLKELLAVLEELDASGDGLGFLVETLEILERIEGELGELGEFDGDVFDEVELGRGPRRPRRAEDGEMPRKLFAAPSNDAGKGHAKKVLGDSRRSLTEGEEHEARLREGKGKSSFGQVKTANDGSRSRTAYRDAFDAAKRAADDVIHRQNVPAGYRSYIRRYFEIMQPDEQRDSGSRNK